MFYIIIPLDFHIFKWLANNHLLSCHSYASSRLVNSSSLQKIKSLGFPIHIPSMPIGIPRPTRGGFKRDWLLATSMMGFLGRMKGGGRGVVLQHGLCLDGRVWQWINWTEQREGRRGGGVWYDRKKTKKSDQGIPCMHQFQLTFISLYVLCAHIDICICAHNT